MLAQIIDYFGDALSFLAESHWQHGSGSVLKITAVFAFVTCHMFHMLCV